MGEVNASPEAATRTMEDLTAMQVDSDKGERLYKAALIHTSAGAAYRMLSKLLTSGRLDLVHYGCDLDADGQPTTKWRIRRILDQPLERFDAEIDTIKKAVAGDGEQVMGQWIHDLSTLPDIGSQSSSLEAWSKEMATTIKGKH